MNTGELTTTLRTLLEELVNGSSARGGFILNRDDPGLLRSLEKLSAEAASTVHAGGASIAAHVDHLRYSLSLMNRWASGEQNPFADADWTESWRRTTVTDEEWPHLRAALAGEARRWSEALGEPREVAAIELGGMVGSIAHFAYHLGAMRQIDRALRGPSA